MAFQLRRGTNAQRLGLTPLQGELIYTTDTKALYVGDGTTAGGTAVGSGGGGGGGAVTLDELTDVVITSPSNGQVLKYNGTQWVNGTDSTGGGGGAGTTYNISAETTLGGTVLRLFGSDLTTDDVVLAEGTNITIDRTDANTVTFNATTAENDVLDYVGPWLETGTNTGISFTFNPTTRAITTTVTQSLDNLTDVNLATPPVADDVLKYDAIAGEWRAGTALLVDDPNPRLGAPLDLNGNVINGTGGITVEGDLTLDGGIFVGGPNNYLKGISITSQSANTLVNPVLTIVNYSGAGSLPFSNILRGRGTADIPATVALGDILGGFRFGGLGTNLVAAPEAASSIFSVADPTGAIGSTWVSGALVFQVRNSAGTLASALTLNQDGVVKFANNTVTSGVNTSSPVKFLKIRVQEGANPVDYYLPLFAAA